MKSKEWELGTRYLILGGGENVLIFYRDEDPKHFVGMNCVDKL